MRGRRLLATGALAVASALVLAACSSGSSTASATKIDTSPSGKGKTLTVWTYEDNTSAMGIAWKEAMKEFTAETGAKVNYQLKSFEQINKTASQVLNSNSAPDVMEYNKGNATAGLLASQGLLTDLTPAVKAYGWDDKLSSSLQTTAKYNSKGIMGSGNWYGVPNYGEFVQVYYNKDFFAKYNIAVPTTFAEFETALATIKSKGVTPIATAAQEYPLGQLLYQLALSKANRQWVTNYQTYTGKVDFHDAAWTFAANTLKDWENKGYIAKNAAGMKAQDAADQFTGAKSPIFYSGSWWYETFKSEIKFNWGSFLFPGSTMAPGSSGNLWVVPTKSKNPSLAEKFIDITMSKKIQNLMGNNGGIPVAADTSAITNAKDKELIANFNTLTARDGLGFYPDWPTSTFYDQINAALQDLLNGQTTPSQMLTTLGEQYAKGVKAITG